MDSGEGVRALEFYSGIGGMHYALRDVLPQAHVMAAFDINDVANAVYAHNFGHQPLSVNLQKVTAKVLDAFKAQLWMLSPPCQPYTRRGLQQGADDRRAGSFLHLMELIPSLQHPPEYLLVENVVGFEASETRQQLWEALSSYGYDMCEFILSPLKLGVPYSRPRYFALARKKPAAGQPSFIGTCPVGAIAQPLLCDPLDLLDPSRQRASTQGHSACPAAAPFASMPEHAAHHASQTDASISHHGARGLQSSYDTGHASVQPLSSFLVADPEAEGLKLLGGQEELMREDAGGRLGTVPPVEQRLAGPRSRPPSRPRAASQPHNGTTAATSAAAASGDAAAGAGDAVAFADAAEVAATMSMHRANSDAAPADGHLPSQHNGHSHHSNGTHLLAANTPVAGWAPYLVPDGVIQQWGEVFDIVTADLRRCNCFTKTYSRYSKGSGSVIATQNLHSLKYISVPRAESLAMLEESRNRHELADTTRDATAQQEQQPDALDLAEADTAGLASRTVAKPVDSSVDVTSWLRGLGLRYFTPKEIANLHSFPPEFAFPPGATLRQRYALVGNSLSVKVVSHLLQYLLADAESIDL